jgi:hypothetical protein
MIVRNPAAFPATMLEPTHPSHIMRAGEVVYLRLRLVGYENDEAILEPIDREGVTYKDPHWSRYYTPPQWLVTTGVMGPEWKRLQK